MKNQYEIKVRVVILGAKNIKKITIALHFFVPWVTLSPKAPPWRPKAAKVKPKGSPKATQRLPKGDQNRPNGCSKAPQWLPEGYQRRFIRGNFDAVPPYKVGGMKVHAGPPWTRSPDVKNRVWKCDMANVRFVYEKPIRSEDFGGYFGGHKI